MSARASKVVPNALLKTDERFTAGQGLGSEIWCGLEDVPVQSAPLQSV